MSTEELQKRTTVNIQEKANLIWAIADKLVGTYKPHEYGNVILPMCVIKRFSDTLAPTKQKVLDANAVCEQRGLAVRKGFLTTASGYDFYNVSPFTFEGLLSDADNIADNFRSYLNHFSENVVDIIEKFDFDKEITKLDHNGILYNVIQEFCSKKAYMGADEISAVDMGYIFEELVRKYSESYDDVRPLIAFSGTVKYQGEEYTESKLNSTEEQKISERQLPLFFNSDMYNVLIVADKYQTGFDEPLLHTMFVDKKLRGVKAVQTLSRLNRSHKGKTDTYILDFINTADDIKKSFQPFYEETLLSDAVDVNVVYEYDTELKKYHLWNTDDEEKVYQIYAKRKQGDKDMGKLASALKPALQAYEVLVEDEQFKVRSLLKNFIRFYAYMAQVVRTFDRELYKTYIFAEFFYRIIPKKPHEKVDLNNKLALINNKLTETFSGTIELKPTEKDKTVNPEKGTQGKKPEEKTDLLANIIEKINIMYAGKFTEADRVIVETIFDRTERMSKKLRRLANNSDAQMFESSIFPKEFDAIAQQCYIEQMDAFAKLFEDAEFYKRVMSEIAKATYLRYRNNELGEAKPTYPLVEEEYGMLMAAESKPIE